MFHKRNVGVGGLKGSPETTAILGPLFGRRPREGHRGPFSVATRGLGKRKIGAGGNHQKMTTPLRHGGNEIPTAGCEFMARFLGHDGPKWYVFFFLDHLE